MQFRGDRSIITKVMVRKSKQTDRQFSRDRIKIFLLWDCYREHEPFPVNNNNNNNNNYPHTSIFKMLYLDMH